MTRAELDMALLGQLAAFENTSTLSVHSTTHRHSASSRQRAYKMYWHGGRRICRKTFLLIHGVSDKRLRNLQQSWREHGLAPRCHGNARRLPANTLTFADTQMIVEFLQTYAEAHAILLPGRIPGYKRTDVQLLPSSTTKRQVWQQYCASLESLSTSHHQAAYSTFCGIWRRLAPHVVVTKPMTDLCWVCQSNSSAIMRATNQPDEMKSEVR